MTMFMNRFGASYVLTTAGIGIALFFFGRWSVTNNPKIIYVEIPPVNSTVEPAPAPIKSIEVTPATTVESLPAYTHSTYEPPLVGMTDALTPIPSSFSLKAVSPAVSSSAVVPTVQPVVIKPVPEPIVLEEIPDNPYKHSK